MKSNENVSGCEHLTVRTANRLLEQDLLTKEDVDKLSTGELLEIPNLGWHKPGFLTLDKGMDILEKLEDKDPRKQLPDYIE